MVTDVIFSVSCVSPPGIRGQRPFWCRYESINYPINCLKPEINPSIFVGTKGPETRVFLWGSVAVQVASVCLNILIVPRCCNLTLLISIINCSPLISWTALLLPMSIQLAGNFVRRKIDLSVNNWRDSGVHALDWENMRLWFGSSQNRSSRNVLIITPQLAW